LIAVVDYGMGNLRSVQKALERVGAEAVVTSDPDLVRRADKVVLPGVGAFGAAALQIEQRGLREALTEAAGGGAPFLGICLGFQLLFDESEESPGTRGLGVLRGRVLRFPSGPGCPKVPHMGWNMTRIGAGNALLAGIPDGSFFYFVHSFYAVPEDPSSVALTSEHGVRFAAMIAGERLFGVQFHPEKSQAMGLRMLRNFAAL